MKFPIYLDNNATTPVDPNVIEAMLPYFNEKFGNPSSKSYWYGLEAAGAVDKSREEIAKLLNASSKEIIFTSCATESINTVHYGIMELFGAENVHIISSEIEHPASLDSLQKCETKGTKVTYLKVNNYGEIDLEELEKAIVPNTKLISLMAANNEIGVLNDLEAIGKICKKHNILFHTDAAQAVGKIYIDVKKFNIDFLSFSGHKIYAPKGIGVLYKKNKSILPPLLLGGGQEFGFRSGTLNVPYIVGLGKAAELLIAQSTEEMKRIEELRNKLYFALKKNLDDIEINGRLENRLKNNLNICFKYVKSSSLISELKTIAMSSGSACSTDNPSPNRVLKAIGLSDEDTYSSIRFGIGRFTTEEEINYAAAKIIGTVKKLREHSPAYMISKTKTKESYNES